MTDIARLFQAFLAPAIFVSATALLILSVNVRLMGMVSRLREYVQAKQDAVQNDRLQDAEAYTVQIDSILELSAHSFQVRWTEQVRDRTGAALDAPTHWEAALQTQVSPPGSDDAIIDNPLGFYVT